MVRIDFHFLLIFCNTVEQILDTISIQYPLNYRFWLSFFHHLISYELDVTDAKRTKSRRCIREQKREIIMIDYIFVDNRIFGCRSVSLTGNGSRIKDLT